MASHNPSLPPAPELLSTPQLSPSFCFNTTALKDFLRHSRAATDDLLTLHLNGLLTPSRTPHLAPLRPTTYIRSRQQVPNATCEKFKSEILFKSWQDRENVLTYCSKVADDLTAADSEAEDRNAQVSMRMPSDRYSNQHHDTSESSRHLQETPRIHSKGFYGQDQVVDERQDPYSARNYSYTRESQADALRRVIISERGVERIVKARTWTLLLERCIGEEPSSHGGSAVIWSNSSLAVSSGAS